ncbi:heparinase II/III-family protein [Halosquirtibacter xylanolyticus]|uniref:heparinase II/III domain-containing protein n=1 Tax=Halosquirtibacter xylanolyticus TaxID=3374599 RepID=UPI00374A77C7|nr:heparinase II/III-family protein [Prolixibacteraceae bacterium]
MNNKNRQWRYYLPLFVTLLLCTFQVKAQKDLIQEESKKVQLETLTFPNYPTYQDKDFWNNVPPKWKQSFIKDGEAWLDYSWPIASAWGYMSYKLEGDRGPINEVYHKRKEALEQLVIAECIERKGRFMPQIINGVYAFCEQTAWSNSAHLSLQKKGIGLPDHNEHIIDLCTGEIAANLALTYYLLKDQFDSIHPLINQRIKDEIQERVLDVYYARDDFWWMGFNTEFVNNWNSWINFNVLNCMLICEEDKTQRTEGVKKLLSSYDKWLNFYHEDGGCEEGATYWGHAGGQMCAFLDLMYKASDGKVNLFNNTKVKNIIQFPMYSYIGNERSVNFADATPFVKPKPGLLYRMSKYIDDKNLETFSRMMAQEYGYGDHLSFDNLAKVMPNIIEGDKWIDKPINPFTWKTKYYPETEVLYARDNDTKHGEFYLAAKGGYNRESHNHNDVGNFMLYYNGQPFIMDVGSGVYTRKTFSSKRYEIWNFTSDFHNVPKINGVSQKDGYEYKATNLKLSRKKSKTVFSLDINQAYLKEADVKQWHRSFDFRYGKQLTVKDNYTLNRYIAPQQIYYMTAAKVEKIKDGWIKLELEKTTLKMKYNAKQYDFEVEEIALKDSKIMKTWPSGVRRMILKSKSKNTTRTCEVTFIK